MFFFYTLVEDLEFRRGEEVLFESLSFVVHAGQRVALAGRNGVGAVAKDTWKTCGPLGFYKGLLPAWIRLLPQTILTFLFFEQFRLYFGYEKPPC